MILTVWLDYDASDSIVEVYRVEVYNPLLCCDIEVYDDKKTVVLSISITLTTLQYLSHPWASFPQLIIARRFFFFLFLCFVHSMQLYFALSLYHRRYIFLIYRYIQLENGSVTKWVSACCIIASISFLLGRYVQNSGIHVKNVNPSLPTFS